MAGREINIECLPEWILEEIFSYLQEKTVLRLVSKHFKHIVDNSPKLMSNYWLKIKAEELNDSNNVANYFYQNIFINFENRDALEVISKCKWAKHVKSIRLEFIEENLLETLDILQSVLFSSDNLQEIFFNISVEPMRFVRESGLQKPTFKCLKKLLVGSRNENCANILGYFADSPNLKILSIKSQISDFIFLNKEASWQLEELELSENTDFMPYFDKFLEIQSRSLKVLKIESELMSNDITRILQNLQKLHITCFSSNNVHLSPLSFRIVRKISDYILNFNDEALVRNDTLRILSIINLKVDSETLRKILLHYKNIQQFYIHTKEQFEFNNLMLSNLKHISVTPFSSELLWRLKMDNLKSLTYLGDSIGFDVLNQMPANNLKNIETLKVENEDVTDILRLFPALKHLFLLSKKVDIKYQFLDGILAKSDLKSISIIESCWQLEKTPQEYLSSVDNEKLVIKLYSKLSEMLEHEDMEIKHTYKTHFVITMIENSRSI